MLENILDTVFFKSIDESPKFRRDNIEASIKYRRQLVEQVIELFELNLVTEVYFQGISTKSYNGNKRNRLKEQEILLIKKIKICEIAKRSFDDVLRNAILYENEFREYFNTREEFETDRLFVKTIIDQFYEDYMSKFEY